MREYEPRIIFAASFACQNYMHDTYRAQFSAKRSVRKLRKNNPVLETMVQLKMTARVPVKATFSKCVEICTVTMFIQQQVSIRILFEP